MTLDLKWIKNTYMLKIRICDASTKIRFSLAFVLTGYNGNAFSRHRQSPIIISRHSFCSISLEFSVDKLYVLLCIQHERACVSFHFYWKQFIVIYLYELIHFNWAVKPRWIYAKNQKYFLENFIIMVMYHNGNV